MGGSSEFNYSDQQHFVTGMVRKRQNTGQRGTQEKKEPFYSIGGMLPKYIHYHLHASSLLTHGREADDKELPGILAISDDADRQKFRMKSFINRYWEANIMCQDLFRLAA